MTLEKKKIRKGSEYILIADVGQNIQIYNGHFMQILQISDEMVGHLFGEFLLTKRLGSNIHKKKRKKKK